MLPLPPHPGLQPGLVLRILQAGRSPDAEEECGVHPKRWDKSGYITVLTSSWLQWGKAIPHCYGLVAYTPMRSAISHFRG